MQVRSYSFSACSPRKACRHPPRSKSFQWAVKFCASGILLIFLLFLLPAGNSRIFVVPWTCSCATSSSPSHMCALCSGCSSSRYPEVHTSSHLPPQVLFKCRSLSEVFPEHRIQNWNPPPTSDFFPCFIVFHTTYHLLIFYHIIHFFLCLLIAFPH